VRVGKLCAFGGEDHVAQQRDRRSQADCRAVDFGNQHLGAIENAEQNSFHVRYVVDEDRRVFDHVLDVVEVAACREGAARVDCRLSSCAFP
jgi:hypothetical protein